MQPTTTTEPGPLTLTERERLEVLTRSARTFGLAGSARRIYCELRRRGRLHARAEERDLRRAVDAVDIDSADGRAHYRRVVAALLGVLADLDLEAVR